MKNSSTALIILLVAAVGLHLLVVAQDFATLAKNGYLYDDSFYAFQIARSISEGHGPTFDGVHLTNGFQPLYVLMLVPVFSLAGTDPITPIYAALVLLALLTVATAIPLYNIVRRYVRPPAALAATGLWLFSPIVIRQSANGLETALALFLLSLAVWFYLDRVRSSEHPSRGAFVKLGLLLGLCALARVDLVLLAFSIVLDYLLLLRRRGAHNGELRGIVTSAAVALIIYSPWMLYGVFAVGSPFQESGTATRFLSIAYAPLFDLGPRTMVADGPSASFVWSHLVHSLTVLKVNPITHVLFRGLEKFTAETPLSAACSIAANVMGIGMILFLGMWVRRRARTTQRGELSFLLLFAVIMIVAYSSWIFGVFFFTRYYYPLFFVGAIFGGLLFEDMLGLVSRWRIPYRRVAMVACALYMFGVGWMAWSAAFRSSPVYHFYDVAQWVKGNIGEDDTLGIFQSGAIGYLSGRKVVNLDGKVNFDARHALETDRLDDYIAEAGIDVVMDDMKVLDLFLGPWDKSDYDRLADRALYVGSRQGAPGWVGYRVSDSAIMRAGSAKTSAGGGSPTP